MLLEKPEMVPFRLTQNCVAVGVPGMILARYFFATVAVRISGFRVF